MNPVRLPPPARPGDRVGVAALSGAVESERLERGLAELQRLGFEPVPAANLRRRTGLFAGTDTERLAAFHELAADPDLKAIFFARGGHGVLRVLPSVDWELLARHPRAYVGYSDLTPFLLQVVRRCGWAAFHGPMVGVDLARGLEPEERDSLLGALAGSWPRALEGLEWWGEGSARGPLLGGCLSLLTATLGTPFQTELDGAILFWEDIEEPLYRIDRMLTQLWLSGSVANLSGMIIGSESCTEEQAQIEAWRDLLREQAASLGVPVASAAGSGHCSPNLTLPLGLEASLDSRRRELLVGLAAGD